MRGDLGWRSKRKRATGRNPRVLAIEDRLIETGNWEWVGYMDGGLRI